MTRAEAKAAMDAGKRIGWSKGAYIDFVGSMDLDCEHGPYVLTRKGSNSICPMINAWYDLDVAFILPERKTRPCTDLEILHIVTKPNRVIKHKGEGHTVYPSQALYLNAEKAQYYEWAEFDAEGTLGPWHGFVVQE